MQIQDQDGNYSDARTVSVKYDKTPPSGSMVVD